MSNKTREWTDAEVRVEGAKIEVRAFGHVFVYDANGLRPPKGAELKYKLDSAWNAVGVSMADFLRKKYEGAKR